MEAKELIIETERGNNYVATKRVILKRPLHIAEIAAHFARHGIRPSCITLNGVGVATVAL